MKDKPPFILYSNLNKPQSSKFSKKYINNKMHIIYSRIPDQIVKKSPVIEKLIHPNPKIYYNIISKYKKPEFIKIDKNMQESQQKKISNLNEFKEMLYNYNKEEREQLENFVEIKKENNQFLHNYKKIQNEKNRFSTGTYLDHQYLIGIANHYAARGIKIPKISVNKNVFSTNPLILGGSDLENYFLYNLGDKKKSNIYLKKVNEKEAHMRNRALIAHWCLEKGSAEQVMELVVKDGKTFLRVNDYEKLRALIATLLAEVQRIKSEGDYEAARELVERYGVKVDAHLHQEILSRYEQLHLAPYKGFLNPVMTPVYNDQGEIVDIQLDYTESYTSQMLRYSKEYGFL